MNIEQAKTIPLAQILEKLGIKPTRERKHESTYLSPLRPEKTPSFQVNHTKNLWFDFGTGKGGDVIGFVRAWLESSNESSTVSDALRWLNNMAGFVPVIKPVATIDYTKEDSNLVLKNAKPINHPALVKYLKARGIPFNVASAYMVEVLVHNTETGKDFFALGFANEDKGYEIRNPFFKGSVGAKAISFIRGKQPKPERIHIFEGFMDYVSAIAFHKIIRFDDDTIVLNSLSLLKQATPYIKGYGYHVAHTWMDNDLAGRKGTKSLDEFFVTEENLRHEPMNKIYHPHKDVNAWHMHRLSLTL